MGLSLNTVNEPVNSVATTTKFNLRLRTVQYVVSYNSGSDANNISIMTVTERVMSYCNRTAHAPACSPTHFIYILS